MVSFHIDIYAIRLFNGWMWFEYMVKMGTICPHVLKTCNCGYLVCGAETPHKKIRGSGRSICDDPVDNECVVYKRAIMREINNGSV